MLRVAFNQLEFKYMLSLELKLHILYKNLGFSWMQALTRHFEMWIGHPRLIMMMV